MASSENIPHENIGKLDKEILIAQNSFLHDELNKYKAKEAMSIADISSMECHCVFKLNEFMSRFKTLFELFSSRLSAIAANIPNGQMISIFTEFIQENFLSLAKLTDNSLLSSENSYCSTQIASKFESIMKSLLEEFASRNQLTDFSDKAIYSQKITALETLNADLLSKLSSITSELDAIKTSLNNTNLLAEIDDVKWKKNLLEKRIASLRTLLSKKMDLTVKELYSSPFYYCYCGGKFLEDLSIRISPDIHVLLSNKAESILKSFYIKSYDPISDMSLGLRDKSPYQASPNFQASPFRLLEKSKSKDCCKIDNEDKSVKNIEGGQDTFEEEPITNEPVNVSLEGPKITSSEASLKLQINLMQKEIKELLDLTEKLTVDKISILKNILSTNFFRKIMKAHQYNLDHIVFLEQKLEDSLNIINEIESMRKKEIFEIREKDIKEKEKLLTQNSLLKREIENYRQKADNLKNVKEKTNGPSMPALGEDQNKTDSVVTSLQKKLEMLIKTVIPNFEDKLKTRDAKIVLYEQELNDLKTNSIDQRIFNSEFRHKTHSSIFNQIREQVNAETNDKLKELEKYVKLREDKIKDLEKTIKNLTRENINEKQQTSVLLEEIAHSSQTFRDMQTQISNLKTELNNSIQNFNTFFKEKQSEKAALETKIIDFEHTIEALRDQLGIKSQQLDLKKNRVSDLEQINQAQIGQLKDQMKLFDQLTKEKSDLMNKVTTLEAEIEILSIRNTAHEKSIDKLTSDLSDCFSQVTQKDGRIQQLMMDINQGNKLNQDESNDLNISANQKLLLNKTELNRLRVI